MASIFPLLDIVISYSAESPISYKSTLIEAFNPVSHVLGVPDSEQVGSTLTPSSVASSAEPLNVPLAIFVILTSQLLVTFDDPLIVS